MHCKHIPAGYKLDKRALLRQCRIPCGICKADKGLWACLEKSCYFNGCGKKAKDHSTEHHKKTGHPVAVNLQTFRCWCCICEIEIKLFNTDEIKALKEERKLFLSLHSSTAQVPWTMDVDCESNTRTSTLGLTGLENLGNTCYMNAALQALSNCSPLTYYFISEYAERNKSHKSGSMSLGYFKMLTEFWNKNMYQRPPYLNPAAIHMSLKTINPSFRGYQQQDTQEFLRCFMDCLHEELKEVVPRWTYKDDLGNGRGEEPASKNKNDIQDSETEDISSGNAKEIDHAAESCPFIPPRDVPGISAAAMRKKQRLSSENELHGTEKSDVSSPRSPSPAQYPKQHNKRPPYRFRSVISELFDGGLRSSVQCLTCDQVSHTRETFQDLSLPIPGKDDLARLHTSAGFLFSGELAVNPGFNGPCEETSGMKIPLLNYAWNVWEWVKGWFWGPEVTLHDCLSAFFSADELKGDNMYSCSKCNKLRNGVKYCKLLQLPELLCIHLKRFRHEYQMSYSSKISGPVSFPIEGLDLSQFLGQDSPSSCSTYDLCSAIIHHGNAGGGHYTAYAKNFLNKKWYEFDDKYVTEVPESVVANAEAYVLFYQKSSVEASRFRDRCIRKLGHADDLLHFSISRRWWTKFCTFAEPGRIDNSDFLCRHSGIRPDLDGPQRDQCAATIPKSVWESLHGRFGGGPAVTQLLPCEVCSGEMEVLERRRRHEDETFRELKKRPNLDAQQFTVYIGLDWFHEWEDFITGRLPDPPGKIDNWPICFQKDGEYILRRNSSYAPISRRAWEFLVSIYDGGPEVPHPLYVAPSQTPKRPASTSSDGTPVKATLNDSDNTVLSNNGTENKSKSVAKSRSLETGDDVNAMSCEDLRTEVCT